MIDLTVPFLLGSTVVVLAVLALSRSRNGEERLDTALCGAAAGGDLPQVEKLLAKGVSPDSVDEEGATALMSAVLAAEVEVVRQLLAAGADPDIQDEAGRTALMHAVIADGDMDLDGAHPLFLEIVEQLLAAGADLELEDEDGATVFKHAQDYDLDEVVALLEGR